LAFRWKIARKNFWSLKFSTPVFKNRVEKHAKYDILRGYRNLKKSDYSISRTVEWLKNQKTLTMPENKEFV